MLQALYKGQQGVSSVRAIPTPQPTPSNPLQGSVEGFIGVATGLFSQLLGLVLDFYGLPMPATLPVSYTSVSRINSAFPMIHSVSNITSVVVAQYAGDVEAEINALISKRYALPLTVECPILTAIATREAIYRIAIQRALVQFPPAQQGQHPMLTQHRDDQKLLDRIATGDIQLVDNAGAVIAGDTSQVEVYSTTKDYLPTFHEGDWGDMVQDEDKLDDIEADRNL